MAFKKYYYKKTYYYTYGTCEHHMDGSEMDLNYVSDSSSQEQPADEYDTSADYDTDNDEYVNGEESDLISSY